MDQEFNKRRHERARYKTPVKIESLQAIASIPNFQFILDFVWNRLEILVLDGHNSGTSKPGYNKSI